MSSGFIFKDIYNTLFNYGKIVYPKGLKVLEILDFKYNIPPYIRFANFSDRKLNLNYIKQEFQWYLRGDPKDLSIITYAKLWNDMVNINGEIPSNYGYYIFQPINYGNQFNFVINELKNDKDSRRASIVILNKDHILSKDKDMPCTYSLNFRIRNENELQMSVHMRSQDAIYGMCNDIPFFSLIHEMVYESLKPNYDNLEMGNYHHVVDSFHIYEKHFEILFKILKESTFEEIDCPKISSKQEVDFLLKNDFSNIPKNYKFSQWLTEK